VSIDLTRARLLEAAGLEFAERGFAGARIRAICDRAGANLAAVNYHFGDKERLYEAAVMEAHRCGTEMPPASTWDVPAPEALRSYIHYFLTHVVALRESSWHQVLMLRELITPTDASETLVREAIRPRFEQLRAILRRLCPDADERRLHALVFSVVGQCLHYKVSAPMSVRLVGPEAYAALDVDYLTDHIAGFTLAALGVVAPLGPSGGPETETETRKQAPTRAGKKGAKG